MQLFDDFDKHIVADRLRKKTRNTGQYYWSVLLIWQCCCSVAKPCPTFCDFIDCTHHTSLSFTSSWSLLKFMSIESVILSNHLILCLHLLLLPSLFPSIRVFFPVSQPLQIRWPKYWSFSINPSNEYSVLISFRIDWFDPLSVQGLSRVFSNTTVWKHQFSGAQPSLWSSSHTHTWLLEKP